MSPRLPRRMRGEPVSPPEPGAQELGGNQDGHTEAADSHGNSADPPDRSESGSEPVVPNSDTVEPGSDESETPTATGPIEPPPVVVPRWVQLVVLPLALLGLWALARAAGSVLLILMVASVAALVLNPLVRTLE